MNMLIDGHLKQEVPDFADEEIHAIDGQDETSFTMPERGSPLAKQHPSSPAADAQ